MNKIKEFTGIQVDDSFFDLGNLKKRKNPIPFNSYSYCGSEAEKAKYDKICEIEKWLTLYEIRKQYINTFNEMIYVPVAIQNNSTTQDNSIRIVLNINGAKPIIPNKYLIDNKMRGFERFVCETDDGISVIRDLFDLKEDGIIHKDLSFGSGTSIPSAHHFDIFGTVEKDENDYENELEEYISFPSDSNYYEFEIESLRAGECKWIAGILMKPTEQDVTIQYQIHSANSSGDLNGVLQIER